jgi:1,4-dihydroxy-2-naphthoate octaprenyltransferase
LGVYPLTQVYQIDEDSARGDRTITVALGQKRALRFGNFCLLLAAGAALVALPFVGIALGYAALILMQEMLARTLPMETMALHRAAMRLVDIGTAGFLALLLFLALSPRF